MTLLIILFGALTLLAGIIIIINPETLFGLFTRNIDALWLHITAVVVRLILGVLLIIQSGVSRFPLLIEIIGWISILAAVFFAVIGRDNFKRIIGWALSLQRPYGRAGGLLAAGFGAFLVYSFIPGGAWGQGIWQTTQGETLPVDLHQSSRFVSGIASGLP